jgi:hypothetical protein
VVGTLDDIALDISFDESGIPMRANAGRCEIVIAETIQGNDILTNGHLDRAAVMQVPS